VERVEAPINGAVNLHLFPVVGMVRQMRFDPGPVGLAETAIHIIMQILLGHFRGRRPNVLALNAVIHRGPTGAMFPLARE
jgi:hypothetical protein